MRLPRPRSNPFESGESIWDLCIPEPNTGCWFWLGALNDSGYGKYTWKGKVQKAHRVSFELRNGPIPTGLELRHTCDQRTCINPDHLVPGTHAENMADMARRRRAAQGKLPRGVYRHHKRFKVKIEARGRRFYLGTFSTLKEAAAVAERAYRELYGE